MDGIYLDHNASTAVDPRVLARFCEVEGAYPGNPGSVHSAGRKSRSILEASRDDLADLFGVAREGVVFVSGGTEANNMVVKTLGDLSRPVLMGPAEHPSVFDAAAQRGRVVWGLSAEGRVQVERPAEEVGLLCLVHAQNEIGTLQPVEGAARLACELGVPLHVDASQSLGRVSIDVPLSVADTLTFSAHKVGGLRGMSVLVRRTDCELRSLLQGGEQELGLRAGTVSPSLAAATALALRLAFEELEERALAASEAKRALLSGLKGAGNLVLSPEASLPNTLMMRFEGVDGRLLLPALDVAGVWASQGSACSTGASTAPRVLTSIGLSDGEARQCVRFSVSHATPVEQANEAARRVVAVVDRMRVNARA